MKISQELIDVVVSGTRAARKYACSKSFYLFKLYYYSDYFAYATPKFHDDFDSDIDALFNAELTEAAWIAFRESAKTSEGKMALGYAICYKKKRYIGYASYDKSNSEAALFDVVVELQTNPKIIADFGHLYTERREKDEAKLKKISSFITTNKIKVEAFSTQESTRGRVYNKNRPDFFILDDIETVKTRDSFPVTRKIIRFIRELKSGMGNQWAILYLGNYISEIGVIAYVMSRVEKNPKGVIRNIPVMYQDPKTKKMVLTWPDKYVMTDQEAADLNKNIMDTSQHKISIESKKRDLDNFEEDMMNNPTAAGQPFFDRAKVDADILKSTEPKEVKASFRIWKKYNPSHRYAVGADTSMGVKLDSNASVFFDFTTFPCQQVASFDSDEIDPAAFAYELKREADIFGTCLVAPETNARSGGTCINQLRLIYPLEKIYRPLEDKKVKQKPKNKIGWETNAATKPEAFIQFKSAYEDGLVEINDIRILKEMRAYTQQDLMEDETSLDPEETTRHFDLLMATVIAWAMRSFAELAESENTKGYSQPAYQSPSIDAPVVEEEADPLEDIQAAHPNFIPHRRT